MYCLEKLTLGQFPPCIHQECPFPDQVCYEGLIFNVGVNIPCLIQAIQLAKHLARNGYGPKEEAEWVDINGGPFRIFLESFRGQVVVVNFRPVLVSIVPIVSV